MDIKLQWTSNFATSILKISIKDNCFTYYKTGYGYFAATKARETYGLTEDYGLACKTNDIVTMIVDLEKYSLRYKVNDHDCGIAFEQLTPKAYRIAVLLYRTGSAIQIV